MLGYTFANIDIKNLSPDDLSTIRKAIPKHGVIHIKNQELTASSMVELTRQFGNPVYLPTALRFNNTQPEFPELARVSNILPDGTLLKDHQAAEYWHSDGDFWQPKQNYIFNFLYAVTVPPKGGATGFSDLRIAYQSLDKELQKRLDGLQVEVSCEDIPDFKDTAPHERQPTAYHYIKHQHIETQSIGLYIGHTAAKIRNISFEESNKIIQELVKAIEKPSHQYIHHWEVGDLLIWDNTSVMHRGMGGYGNHPRLLYRTQAFIDPS